MRLGHHYYDSGDLSFHFAVIIVLLWAHGGLFNNLFKKKKKINRNEGEFEQE